ncbi:MAG: Uma2 family endonuclease [Anaerolineae bacterium]|nr:Uma2 family endonuclease [Anaerolineae bacterium]
MNATQLQKEVREIVTLLMKRPITEAIALDVETHAGFEHLEIEGGQWVGFDEDETMAGEEHGRIEFRLLLRLGNHVELHKLGNVYPGDTVFVLHGSPEDIQIKRRPDLAFVSRGRVKPTKGYIYAAPDIAVEIISPTERPTDIRQKLREYLDYGVQQVWQVFPESQEIQIHLPDGTARTYRAGEVIDGGDLLLGFQLDVATVFAE